MKAAPFDYAAPKTLSEASKLLASANMTTAAIAGGQSLLPMLNLRVALPGLVVDVGRLEELKGIEGSRGGLRVGALTTHAAIEDGAIPGDIGRFMQRVASTISYRAVRNHGTVGGSVALADPAADWPGCLLALGARVRIAGLNGARSQAIDEFLRGQYATSLTPDEIIVGFDLPSADTALRWGFFKVVRKSGAFANSIAYAVSCGRGGLATVVLAAAAERPCLLPTVAERIEAGESADEPLLATISKDVTAHVSPDDRYLMRLHTSTVMRAVREMQNR
jgi:carbon-monoxide dehydrogenase medium subunit